MVGRFTFLIVFLLGIPAHAYTNLDLFLLNSGTLYFKKPSKNAKVTLRIAQNQKIKTQVDFPDFKAAYQGLYNTLKTSGGSVLPVRKQWLFLKLVSSLFKKMDVAEMAVWEEDHLAHISIKGDYPTRSSFQIMELASAGEDFLDMETNWVKGLKGELMKSWIPRFIGVFELKNQNDRLDYDPRILETF